MALEAIKSFSGGNLLFLVPVSIILIHWPVWLEAINDFSPGEPFPTSIGTVKQITLLPFGHWSLLIMTRQALGSLFSQMHRRKCDSQEVLKRLGIISWSVGTPGDIDAEIAVPLPSIVLLQTSSWYKPRAHVV
jgi:hypothetical protein